MGTIGLGRYLVRGRTRVPWPAAKIIPLAKGGSFAFDTDCQVRHQHAERYPQHVGEIFLNS